MQRNTPFSICTKFFLACLAFSLANEAMAGPSIFLFGGATSTKSQVQGCYPAAKVEAFGYPPAGGEMGRVIATINANPDRKFIVAGHSSGAKYANRVASQVKNPSRITLVDLDGYAPRSVPKAVHRVCWKAVNGSKLASRNAPSMAQSNNCEVVKTYTSATCKTRWCLHFALVNKNVPGNLNDRSWITQGYKSCSANLDWATQ
ncbi:MAG: hypothetical protein ACXVBE_01485 [Bdellovibrionota bacterium]